MFIINDDERMMAVSHGDSAYFTITFTGDVPEDGVNALFTVKETPEGTSLIRKYLPVHNGVVDIELYSQDTGKLKPGKYIWDIRVIFSDKEVVTPIVPSPFIILEVAGDV